MPSDLDARVKELENLVSDLRGYCNALSSVLAIFASRYAMRPEINKKAFLDEFHAEFERQFAQGGVSALSKGETDRVLQELSDHFDRIVQGIRNQSGGK